MGLFPLPGELPLVCVKGLNVGDDLLSRETITFDLPKEQRPRSQAEAF